MVRWALSLLLVAALVSSHSGSGLRAAGLGQAPDLEFEVASIKRNLSDRPLTGPPPRAGAGEFILIGVPARVLVMRAYPLQTTPIQIVGLPSWADSERYDVIAKGKPDSKPEDVQQMWRALLADRLKLQAHYETRPRAAYKMVLARADRKLGAQLKPSTLNCPPPDPSGRPEVSIEARDAMMATIRDRRAATPQEEAVLLSQCRGSFNAWNTMYAGALEIKALIQAMSFLVRLDRPVVDETGLQGMYSIKLWAAPPAAPSPTAGPASAATPAVNDAPDLFTALQDQLGLKLEPTTIDGQVVVVDHIERPTEN